MNDDFLGLAVRDEATLTTYPLASYRALPDAERAALAVNFEYGLVSVVQGGQERLATWRSMGMLWLLVQEMQPALDRLAAGQTALIRSAVMGAPEGNYVLLEPAADGQTVLVSLVVIEDESVSYIFPHHAPDSDVLYAYAAANAHDLKRQASQDQPSMVDVVLPTAVVLAGLTASHAHGTALNLPNPFDSPQE
jgi:hypothetical protein